MGTGEGKSLTCTCAVYLNALAGKGGSYLVTVNDYLARRDAEVMGQVQRPAPPRHPPPPPATARHATPRHATPHERGSQCARAVKGGSRHGETSRLVSPLIARGPLVAVQVYQFLGMSVGLVQAGMTPAERRDAYACDIKYVTNQELGFDFLRDNLAMTKDEVPSPSRAPTACSQPRTLGP